MTHAYTAYGLTFHLPFPCPILPVAADDAEPDVRVVEGPVPRQLDAPAAQDQFWQAETGRFLLKAGRRAGRFLVENGRVITLERGAAAEDEMIGLHFADSVLAAALRQNGMLVLHANAVATRRGALAISGVSGAGKSTTLATLLRRGCAMLADDLTVLRPNAEGELEVLPGLAQLCLCKDVATRLGGNVHELSCRSPRRKFVVPTHGTMAKSPFPLRALYLLCTHAADELRIHRLEGSAKFEALQESIYGPMLPGEQAAVLPLFATLLQQIKVFCVDRPQNRWTADELAEVILRG